MQHLGWTMSITVSMFCNVFEILSLTFCNIGALKIKHSLLGFYIRMLSSDQPVDIPGTSTVASTVNNYKHVSKFCFYFSTFRMQYIC